MYQSWNQSFHQLPETTSEYYIPALLTKMVANRAWDYPRRKHRSP